MFILGPPMPGTIGPAMLEFGIPPMGMPGPICEPPIGPPGPMPIGGPPPGMVEFILCGT